MIQDLLEELAPVLIEVFLCFLCPIGMLYLIYWVSFSPAKRDWNRLLAIKNKRWNFRTPPDLEFHRVEEMKLQQLSTATAFYLDKDGHRSVDASASSVLQVVELSVCLEDNVPHTNYLFIRDFYPRLVQRIFLIDRPKQIVLMGSEGISKSFFHWYVYLINLLFFFKKKKNQQNPLFMI